MQCLRQKAVLSKIAVSQATLWRMVRSGSFPAPIRLSTNSVGWLETEIDEWIAKRMANRVLDNRTGVGS